MPRSPHTVAYHTVLRELSKASPTPRTTKNTALLANFRAIFEKYRLGGKEEQKDLDRDVHNAITFMRSQREYKRLLERYNPLINLTGEERIHATAHRVGFNMPKVHAP